MTREERIGVGRRAAAARCRALGLAGVGVGDAEADDAEPRVGREAWRHARRWSWRASRPSSSRKSNMSTFSLAAGACKASCADALRPPGDAQVLGQFHGSDAVGHLRDGRAVADDVHLDRIRRPLGDAESEQGPQPRGRLPMVMMTAPTFVGALTSACWGARMDTCAVQQRLEQGDAREDGRTEAGGRTGQSRAWSTIARTEMSSAASMPRISRWELQRRAASSPGQRQCRRSAVEAPPAPGACRPGAGRRRPGRSPAPCSGCRRARRRVPRKAHSQSIRCRCIRWGGVAPC